MAHADPLTVDKRTAARNRALAVALSEFPTEAAKHLKVAEVADEHLELIARQAEALAAFQALSNDDVRAHAAKVLETTTGALPAFAVSVETEAAHLAVKAASAALHEFRSYWRTLGVLAGTRGPVAVENNTED